MELLQLLVLKSPPLLLHFWLLCMFVFTWALSAYATVAGNTKAPTINAIAANAAIATYAFVFMCLSLVLLMIFLSCMRKFYIMYSNLDFVFFLP
jgi:hypothetical protein